MREIAEFRVDEKFASILFSDGEGKRLGTSIRQILIDTTDERFAEIGRLQRELRAREGKPFFYGCILRRTYSKAEIASALLFHLDIAATFEPAGEEKGTIYDESTSCPNCASGAKQIGPLILDVNHIPKTKDIARTIAGEIVVSRRASEVFNTEGVTGISFGRVQLNRASSAESKDWFQLILENSTAEIMEPTRIGINPFDNDPKGECRCPLGDLLGLNLLSEVTIRETTRGVNDFVASRQYVGVRRGLLRPERIILVSPKVRELIESKKLKGFGLEVAHLG